VFVAISSWNRALMVDFRQIKCSGVNSLNGPKMTFKCGSMVLLGSIYWSKGVHVGHLECFITV